MRDAITTSYIPATDSEGAMIRAASEETEIIRAFRGSISHVANHQNAAVALCRQHGWPGRIVGGSTNSDACFVWVFVDDPIPVSE